MAKRMMCEETESFLAFLGNHQGGSQWLWFNGSNYQVITFRAGSAGSDDAGTFRDAYNVKAFRAVTLN